MNAKNIMNLTPHAVDIYGDEGLIVTVQPSGTVARVAEKRESCPPVAIGLTVIDVSRATYGAVTGLPASDGETIYIVSALVLAQCAGRQDVYAPGPAIRDDAGRQMGCHGLSATPARPERTWDDRDHVCEHGVDLSDDCPACGRVWPPLAKEITDLADNPAIDWGLDVGDLMYAEWRAGAQGGAPPPQHQTLAEAFQRHDLSHA